MKMYLIISVVSMIFLSGCGSVKPKDIDKKVTVIEKIDENRPLWIDNPFLDGFIVGVGSSNNKNVMFKRRVATALARANLAEAIKVEMKTYMNITTKKTNGSMIETTEQIIEQNAKELLVGSEIDDTYQDSDGTYYVLVILNKRNIR